MINKFYTKSDKLVLKKQRSFRKLHFFIFWQLIPFMQVMTSIAGLVFFALFLSGKMGMPDFLTLIAFGIWIAILPLLAKKIPHRRWLRWNQTKSLKLNRWIAGKITPT